MRKRCRAGGPETRATTRPADLCPVSQPENPHQAIYNIAALCAAHGLTEVVLSPGSRCAPLTLAFARHPATNVRVVPDERAAAFIGLGIAQARRVPTVLVCTSGTAGLNYAPAVAEAYYQQVPLLILTADRPPEWIDQLDGQTIRQNGLYGPHVKGAYTFPVETTHPDAKWHANRLMNEAINLAKAYPPGPVHVNIPLREPLYPTGEVVFEEVRVVKDVTMTQLLLPADIESLAQEFSRETKILIAFGQQSNQFRERFHIDSNSIYDLTKAVFLGEIISNVSSTDDLEPISTQDIFLNSGINQEQLRPDLLITCGKSFISKAFKKFIRQHPPKHHWHIQMGSLAADPFTSITRIIKAEPASFLNDLLKSATPWEGLNNEVRGARNEYFERWFDADWTATTEVLNSFLYSKTPHPWSEMASIGKVLTACSHPSSYGRYVLGHSVPLS